MNLFFDLFVYDPGKPFLFTQMAFWIYFAIVYLLFTLCYKNITRRNYLLFLVSLFFYYKTGGLFIVLLLFSIILNFFIGLLLGRAQKKGIRKLWLTLGIILNLSVLCYYKYTYLLIDGVNHLLGSHIKVEDYIFIWANEIFHSQLSVATIVLPVGISFFTFQGLSYLIDIYRNELQPLKDLLEFGFFKSFFPQLVAGPIVRASDFIPQISRKFTLSRIEFGQALLLIINGLIKKMIISDYISLNFVDRVFDNPHMFSGAENLLAVYGYAVQIYCDFSGYTDIAIGLALLMGFRIPVNFNSPYKAYNLVDFWRRWHISLSKWLRDYLYIPLGGNRKGKIRTHLNLLITMLLGGLWHGANIKFIIWGGLHGLGLAFNKILFGIKSNLNKQVPWWQKVLGWVVTFHFVCLAWIFFRASDARSAFSVIENICTRFSPEILPNIILQYAPVLGVLSLGLIIHWLPANWKLFYRQTFSKAPMVLQAVMVLLTCLIIYQFKTSNLQPFIYFQF